MLGSWYHDDNVIIILIIPELFLIFLRLSAIFMGTYGTWRRSCTACHPTLELSKPPCQAWWRNQSEWLWWWTRLCASNCSGPRIVKILPTQRARSRLQLVYVQKFMTRFWPTEEWQWLLYQWAVIHHPWYESRGSKKTPTLRRQIWWSRLA